MQIVYFAKTFADSNGIGVYTKNIANRIPADTKFVEVPSNELRFVGLVSCVLKLCRSSPDVIHIQYTDRMFPPWKFKRITDRGHFTFVLFLFLLTALSRIRSIKLYLTVHEARNPDNVDGVGTSLIALIHRVIEYCCNEVIVLSDRMESNFGGDPIILLHGSPLAVAKATDREEARQEFNIDPNSTVCILPGYVYERKGTDVFIDIARSHPDKTFLIAGGPSSGNVEFANFIRERAPENVRYTGVLPYDRYNLAIEAADIAILPYRHINQSGVVNDCAAHCLPVVATDLPYFRKRPGVLTVNVNIPSVDEYPRESWSGVNKFNSAIDHALTNREHIASYVESVVERNSFDSVAKEHFEMYT